MHERPNLLVLTSTLPRFADDPEPGFVLNLSKALTADFDITVLAPMGEGAPIEETVDGLSIIRYRYAPFRSWETLAYPGGIMPRLRQQPWRWAQVPMLMLGLIAAVRRLHGQRQFDLIHAHWLVPQGLAVLCALPDARRPPMVVTSHGGDLHILGHSPAAGLIRWVLQRSSALTTVSPLLADEAKALLGHEPPNLAVIPMGVDVEKFSKKRMTTRSCSRQDGEVRLLFVGRLAEKKGVRFLLEALATRTLSQKPVRLQVAGDGPLRQDLEQQARYLKVDHRVEFLGGVPYRQVSELMTAADILVVPSVEAADGDSEGLPTVILEGMAAHLVVVTTPVGGIRQAIDDQCTGRLVPPADAAALAEVLAGLLESPAERQRLAANAFEAVQAYDWKQIAQRYAELLKAVLRGRPGEQTYGP
jgi:glycosyltransferase involved in cell wall biosynthesis